MDIKKLYSVDLVAFDFFDTLVHRTCDPEKILSMWAKAVKEKYSLSISSSEIYKIRKQSEIKLRKSGFQDVTYRQMLCGIHSELTALGFLEQINISEFESASYQIEYQYELEHLFLDAENMELARICTENGKDVIIISDFYHSKEFIGNICKKLGIRQFFKDIYVSCDYNARKSTGELYKVVLKLNDTPPKRCLMIGDHPISDQRVPGKMGIQVFPVNYTGVSEFITDKNEMERIARGMSNGVHVLDGYVGIMYLFTARLYEIASVGKCRKLLFCSREGQLLKKLFDIYQEIAHKDHWIDNEYLYISRRATFLASLRECGKEDFSRMFLNYDSLTVVDFLDNIGFNQGEIADVLGRTGIERDMSAVPRGKRAEFDEFLKNDEFIRLFNEKREEANLLLKEYIQQINGNSPIWMVDIGWRGSIQDNLFLAFGQKVEITGLYFGLKNAVRTAKNKKIGIIFDNYEDEKNYSLMSFNYLDLEKVCAADHGPVIGYDRKGKMIEPKILESEEELAIYRYMKEGQDRLAESFARLCLQFDDSIYGYSDLVDALKSGYLFHLCVRQPENYKYYFDYRNIVVENFGAKTTEIRNKFTFKGYSEQFHWGLVNYIFRFLDKAHLKAMYPVGRAYCRFLYCLKKRRLKRVENEWLNQKI